MTFGKKLVWFSILALVMQFGLSLSWLATISVAISQLTVKQPELQKLLEQLQSQSTLTPLTPGSSDTERMLQTMMPVLSQLNWPIIALACSFFSFGILGFAYARLTGQTDYLGGLPLLALISGQNPITLALDMARQGVSQATLNHFFEAGLLLVQLITIYTFALLGQKLYNRKLPAGTNVTPR